jgi:hypothetical protein
LPTVDDFILSKYNSMGSGVVSGAQADGDHVRITRPFYRPVRFGVVKLPDVTAADIAHLFDGDVDFIMNIPKVGIFQEDAIELCLDENVGWGGLADSMRAVQHEDPQTYISSIHSFVIKGLNRHSHVLGVSFLDSRRLLVTRTGRLGPLVLYIEDAYQAEVSKVRFAIDRCSPFDIFVAADPNSGPTDKAVAAAESAGLEILRWPDTLRRLRR